MTLHEVLDGIGSEPPARTSPTVPVLQFVDRPGILDLGWGHPRPELLPVEGWREATAATARTRGWQWLTYGHAAGPGPLVDWLAAHLGRQDGAPADAGRMFVTAGASHALWLLATVLAEPGDAVLVDTPTYHYGLRILRDRGVDLVPVPTDRDGLDPDALPGMVARLRAEGRRPALLYTVPTFANPTGRTLPADRRMRLVDVARRLGLVVVEDDTYRELHYEAGAPPSLWSIAGGEPVVRVGSFAKTVGPGLRLGWVNAEPALVGRLAALGYVDSGGCVNHSVALTMAEFGASGEYDRHVARMRQAYRKQRDALVAGLRAACPHLSFHTPGGGWFLWAALAPGLDAAELLPRAEAHGVSFVEGSAFFPGGAGGGGHVRLSFSMLSAGDLAEAAARLGTALAEAAEAG